MSNKEILNCGCGGEAKVIMLIPEVYAVECSKCWIRTGSPAKTEAEAIQIWNRAMGAKNIYVPSKGFWRVNYDGHHCSVCNYKCETTALPDMCPHCGTNMNCG